MTTKGPNTQPAQPQTTPKKLAQVIMDADEPKRLREELEKAYRALHAYTCGRELPQTAQTYHSPAVGAARRFVLEGKLDGTSYFIGKPIEVLHKALRTQATPPSPAAELDYHKVDKQVLRAAADMSEADKKEQPEWLWYNHNALLDASRFPTFGRWGKFGDQVPYIRADLLVQVLQDAALEVPAPVNAALPAGSDVETDAQMQRDYIPLAGGYEFQTKGTGSTARLVCPDGERIPFGDAAHVTEALEAMVRAQHAALSASVPREGPAMRETPCFVELRNLYYLTNGRDYYPGMTEVVGVNNALGERIAEMTTNDGWVKFVKSITSPTITPHAAITQPVPAGKVEVSADLLERIYEVMEGVAVADSGDPEQDAFEREVFDELKRKLGK